MNVKERLLNDIKTIIKLDLNINTIIIEKKDWLVLKETDLVPNKYFGEGCPLIFGFKISIENNGVRRDREFALTKDDENVWRLTK